MSRKLTKKENQIWEILQTEFNPFTEKYPDAWTGWEFGGLDEKENDFAMGICIQPFSFNEKITKQKEKFAEKMLEDELVNECFISFMNKLACSTSASSFLDCQFEIADIKSFSSLLEASFWLNFKIVKAMSTFFPLTESATILIFLGEVGQLLSFAKATCFFASLIFSALCLFLSPIAN